MEAAIVPACCLEYSSDAPLNAGGRWDGFGRAKFSSGAVYEGQWEGGHLHGQGKITFPDGISYEGTFTRSALTGKGVSNPPPPDHWHFTALKCALDPCWDCPPVYLHKDTCT